MALWGAWFGRDPRPGEVRSCVVGETIEAAALRLCGCSRAARDIALVNAGRTEASVLEGGEQIVMPRLALHRRWEDAWSESIRAPEDVVFDVLATRFFATCTQWVYRPGVVRPSMPAPVRAGSAGTLEWEEGGGRDVGPPPGLADPRRGPARHRWSVRLEVTVCDPPRAFAWRASHGELGGYESYRFALEGDVHGTHVRGSYKNETARRWNTYRRLNGYAPRGLIPAMRHLKALVERTHAGEPAAC